MIYCICNLMAIYQEYDWLMPLKKTITTLSMIVIHQQWELNTVVHPNDMSLFIL